LNNLTQEVLFAATDEMNNRPRKDLKFKTPLEVFTEIAGYNHIDFYRGGALMS
jgi:IS30 family transposase